MLRRMNPKSFAVLLSLGVLSSAAFGQRPELNTIMMNSTFMVDGKTAEGIPSSGTCFILGSPMKDNPAKLRFVLITAKHLLANIAQDVATVHLRKKEKDGAFSELPFPLTIRNAGRELWTTHPDKEVDIAVMRVSLPTDAYLELASTDLLANDAMLQRLEVHPGDELFCLGYPFGLTANTAGFPILRSGRIASYPILPTTNTKTMLFDFSVYPGNSGGPVYFVQSGRYYESSFHAGTTNYFIAGLVSEYKGLETRTNLPFHFSKDSIPLNLGVVVHASLIKETIARLPEDVTASP